MKSKPYVSGEYGGEEAQLPFKPTLLHVHDIIIVKCQTRSYQSRVDCLIPRYTIAIQNGWQASDIDAKDIKFSTRSSRRSQRNKCRSSNKTSFDRNHIGLREGCVSSIARRGGERLYRRHSSSPSFLVDFQYQLTSKIKTVAELFMLNAIKVCTAIYNPTLISAAHLWSLNGLVSSFVPCSSTWQTHCIFRTM